MQDVEVGNVHHFFVTSILGCVHPRNAEVGNVQVFCINKVFVMKKRRRYILWFAGYSRISSYISSA